MNKSIVLRAIRATFVLIEFVDSDYVCQDWTRTGAIPLRGVISSVILLLC
jgi:hypothetical protein